MCRRMLGAAPEDPRMHTSLAAWTLAALVLSATPIGAARAQLPFSQSFTHPTGLSSTSSAAFSVSPVDTAVTCQPLVPPDNDFGIAPITSSLEFSGETLHWKVDLDLGDPLFHYQSYTASNNCTARFRLYGVGSDDTAIVTVRVIAKVEVVRERSTTLENGRVTLSSNLGSDTFEYNHLGVGPATVVDTIQVPVRVLGNTQSLTFQLNMLAHLEGPDPGGPRVEVTADASFPNLAPGLSPVNAHGYGSVVLGASGDAARVGTLRARSRADGRALELSGVVEGAAEVALFDVTGREIARTRARAPSTGELVIELPGALKSGVYFLRCLDGGGVRATRFALVR